MNLHQADFYGDENKTQFFFIIYDYFSLGGTLGDIGGIFDFYSILWFYITASVKFMAIVRFSVGVSPTHKATKNIFIHRNATIFVKQTIQKIKLIKDNFSYPYICAAKYVINISFE